MNLPRAVFADTNFYIAGVNARDQYRRRAAEWLGVLSRGNCRFVTTEAVLWEFLNSCSAPVLRKSAYPAYRRFHSDPTIEVVGFEPALIERAMEMYDSHADKHWGENKGDGENKGEGKTKGTRFIVD